MINRIVHFSDLHIRLFKDHDQYREILKQMLKEFNDLKPDRIVFTGDLVHSKNQMTPELVDLYIFPPATVAYIFVPSADCATLLQF